MVTIYTFYPIINLVNPSKICVFYKNGEFIFFNTQSLCVKFYKFFRFYKIDNFLVVIPNYITKSIIDNDNLFYLLEIFIK